MLGQSIGVGYLSMGMVPPQCIMGTLGEPISQESWGIALD